MSVIDLVKELMGRGVILEPDGSNLKVIGPTSALTEKARGTLAAHKGEVIEMRKRSAEIKSRIRNALSEVDKKYAGRIDWERDTPNVKASEMLLNAAMTAYANGTCDLEAVQEKFKVYIRALLVQEKAKQPGQPDLFDSEM
jgi:TubC N-terminal docking domain